MSPTADRPSLPGRAEIIREHRAHGGKVAAVFPIHYPRALLRAHGVLPVEMWGPPSDMAIADQHLQAYTCNVVRSGLAFILGQKAGELDLFVIPHCCDSAQGLASVLIDFAPPSAPVVPFYLPRGDAQASLEFAERELEKLARRLSEITGATPSEAELSQAIAREEEADAALGELLGARAKLPLSNADFYRLVRSREYLPAERFTGEARRALAAKGEPQKAVPVMFSGIVPEPRAVLEELDRLGGRIVADDFACTGRRAYPAGSSQQPMRRLAESLLGGPPDSTRGSTVDARAAHLVRLAKSTGARLAVFFHVKFCEPEQFYLPALRKALEAEGVRSIAIELHPNEPLPHQAVTRIEALLETEA